MKTVGRFAPSPSGELHAGNIFSSLIAWLMVHFDDGEIVLRIEDLDPQRSKREFAEKIMRDYEKLGLSWDRGPYFQSTRDATYRRYFDALDSKGMVYPCFCTRADLHAASAPHAGEVFTYAGTCRTLSAEEREDRIASGTRCSFRLETADNTVEFIDILQGERSVDLGTDIGDFVIKRSDGVFAYQLAVVIDDEEQAVNSVVRGYDLLASTAQQVYLQSLLGFSRTLYCHVPLFVDSSGRRLSKRNGDAELDTMVDAMGSYEAVIGAIAHKAGLIPEYLPLMPEELLRFTNKSAVIHALSGKHAVVWESTNYVK